LVAGATIVHIPELSGYWAHAREVLQACLASFARTAPGVPLSVFDNASHPSVRAFLLDQLALGNIHQLTLSKVNVGKVGAWNVLFGAGLSDYFAYFDSDVLFLPGWLEKSLELARAFPEAGMITAQPIAGGDLRSLWTAQLAKTEPSTHYEEGIFVSDSFLEAHLAGLGSPLGEALAARQTERVDVRLTRSGVSGYATASHFQFLVPEEVVRQLFPVPVRALLGDDLQFDEDMEALGLWRLSTTEYLVHHLGNRLPNLQAELPWLEAEVGHLNFNVAPLHPRRPLLAKIARLELPRRALKRVAALIHETLASSNV
jgi:hypothetical protein